ncbi:ParA family protein [Curtobacterium sp. MCBD17_040]|uniref:ParA family protein n=1 Tax=Curtobacterium sp. MCBD17_040 TaxID=2175674 RepID=UPI001C64D130|nr:ParA family protein [Curtobacterium sp. MCBD17_040]WIB65614.1 ParA family protein [Curtobacterium sp. MCBD17_040]
MRKLVMLVTPALGFSLCSRERTFTGVTSIASVTSVTSQRGSPRGAAMAITFDRSDLQRVVAVINNKGGVGKTTLCANIGGILAEAGWRVLIVDLDPQGNLALDLGYRHSEGDDGGEGLSKSLLFGDAVKPVKNVRPNLDVVPGGSEVEFIDKGLGPRMSQSGDVAVAARLSLAKALAPVGANYDVILLDCPPNTDAVQMIAIAAARYFLIPAKADDASIEGLTLTARRSDKVLDINPDIDLLGVVNFASSTSAKNVRKEFADDVVKALNGEEARATVFESYVRHSEATAKAARAKGLLVHELDKSVKNGEKWYEALRRGVKHVSPGPQSAGNVADSLYAVTQEFIARLTQKEEETAQEVTVNA